MRKLTKLDILFIRACKSKKSTNRIYSTYRRFYGKYNMIESAAAIVSILAEIVTEFEMVSVAKYINEMSPNSQWLYKSNNKENEYCSLNITPEFESLREYYSLNISYLASKIRYSDVRSMDGFIVPLRFKK